MHYRSLGSIKCQTDVTTGYGSVERCAHSGEVITMPRAFLALSILLVLPWAMFMAEPEPSTWCPEPCTCSEEQATPRKLIPPYWTSGKIEWKSVPQVDKPPVNVHLYLIDCTNRELKHAETVLNTALLTRHHTAYNDTATSSHLSSPYITTL